MTTLIRALIRNFEPHWNQTVNKVNLTAPATHAASYSFDYLRPSQMSAHVLEIMKERYPKLWESILESLYSESEVQGALASQGQGSSAGSPADRAAAQSEKRMKSEALPLADAGSDDAPLNPNLPPPPRRGAASGPVGGIGIGGPAPLPSTPPTSSAFDEDDFTTRIPTAVPAAPPTIRGSTSRVSDSSAQNPASPMSAMTSVPKHMAKFMTAMPSAAAGRRPLSSSQGSEAKEEAASSSTSVSPTTLNKHIREDDTSGKSPVVRKVEEYMKRLLPDDDPVLAPIDREGMNVAPTILPDLKFHDLVFGKVLGTGSFSTVKYAMVRHAKAFISPSPQLIGPPMCVSNAVFFVLFCRGLYVAAHHEECSAQRLAGIRSERN